MAPPPLPRRTLRSGREFSAFDLALGIDFDIQKCLHDRLLEQQSVGQDHELEEKIAGSALECPVAKVSPTPDFLPQLDDLCPVVPPQFSSSAATSSVVPPSSSSDLNKLKSKARRARARDRAQQASENPRLKGIHRTRINEAKPAYLEVWHDANGLPHTVPAWIGNRSAEDQPFFFTPPQPLPRHGETGMGGRLYSQAEVDALTGTIGFTYIAWLGLLTIPILDSRRRIIALLGGAPKDIEGWTKVTDGAFALMQDALQRIKLPEEKLDHRRAQEPFAAVGRGLSHGGGQTEPGELQQNVTNTRVTDKLMAHSYFQRIVGFTNVLFSMWAPNLFCLYQETRKALELWGSHLRWNFENSVFAACTFNFGPRAITCPHLDFANLAWGWCAITALGTFDPDAGGHLILWDLRLVIRFPPGSTVFIPSAIIRHSNVGILSHELRSSFTQYTAGGLFRWVRNGFMTDEDFEKKSSVKEKVERSTEAATRWQDGMNMFSVIDDL